MPLGGTMTQRPMMTVGSPEAENEQDTIRELLNPPSTTHHQSLKSILS